VLVIRRSQLEVLEEAARRKLEDRVLDGLAEPFDRQLALLGRERMRAVVRLGVARAAAHDVTADRLVLSYVALMLMLGAFFDEDPQVPWAGEELAAPATSAAARLDRVYGAAMDHLDRVAGPENEHLVRALFRVRDFDLGSLAAVAPARRVEAITAAFSGLYPEKAEAQGPDATREAIARGVAVAADHDLRGLGAALCGGLSFMMGTGFAADPQVPWVASILALPAGAEEKTAALHREVMAFVDFGLSGAPR
jgi:hypothetical protein